MRRIIPFLAVIALGAALVGTGAPELRAAQAIDWSSRAARQETQDFQQFLASHPWIAQKLRGNPSLANDQGFLNDNPELPQFLNAHPFVQTGFKTDARGFMTRAQQGSLSSGYSPANYQEMQDFQQFLTSHTWIAGKLRQNPSLASDPNFLNGNRELPQFLNAHPYIQSSLKADAKGFMLRMQDFAASPPAPSPRRWDSWDSPENRQEMADFQDFLNARTWLANSLQNDPSLANNQEFLNGHYDVRQFLNNHPYVQHGLQADATGFMRRMQRWGMSQAAVSGGDWSNRQQQELQDFTQFLSDHPWIANKLRQNPALANDRDFANNNPPLAQFLNSHPYAQSQFRADPNAFMQRAQGARGGGMPAGAYDPHATDYAALNRFMVNHPWIGKQLKEKPSRATSADFLDENKELRDFLQAHPYLQQQFKQDPRGTIERANQVAGQY